MTNSQTTKPDDKAADDNSLVLVSSHLLIRDRTLDKILLNKRQS
jgi:hypothetical protein